MKAFLVFPHQLFKETLSAQADAWILIEEPLFFSQFKFHQKKILLHRASMKHFEKELHALGKKTIYFSAPAMDSRESIFEKLRSDGFSDVEHFDTVDDWVEKKIRAACEKHHLLLKKLESPNFLTAEASFRNFFAGKKTFLMHSFYVWQRKRLGILVRDGEPEGGMWSFDKENRKKLPKDTLLPPLPSFSRTNELNEAEKYARDFFSNHYGNTADFIYPLTREHAESQLQNFLKYRFQNFGIYEDAIAANESYLFHSLLTPALNIGLLSPKEIVRQTLNFAKKHGVPLNSVEGFIRQIIGWREFIRAVYILKGRTERTANFWNHQRKLPESFWSGTTGITPVDTVIKRVLKTGYCHHIERLMILGNFMLLCEIQPDDVYRWFMELFIDAYDWVMVPNVYGMSQFADGGLMATKPYISGSNYILKMSDFKKGPWCEIWDGLFWRFIHKNKSFFEKNPRLQMMVKQIDKMDPARKIQLFQTAENFLARL